MSIKDQPEASRILAAIQAKRERRQRSVDDIAALEAALLADLENFDLSGAEQEARRQQYNPPPAGLTAPDIVFPDILADSKTLPHAAQRASGAAQPDPETAKDIPGRSSLLDQLRRQAQSRQVEQRAELNERSIVNETIDHALKKTFFFLHDLVQQLNILKPGIPRDYPISEQLVLAGLTWQQGFADYRVQGHGAAALVELSTFTAQLASPRKLSAERDGAVVERFRAQLFDYGLPFACKEFRNARGYVERAQFEVDSTLNLSARFRANFERGEVDLEMRNIERLGSTKITLPVAAVDAELLDDFGRLILGHPNRFRELARRR